MPLTVIQTMPARYAAPKIPIPATIVVRSFQILGLELISLCTFYYSYSAEKINCFLQKRVSYFVHIAQFPLFCSRILKTCRITFAGILQFA